MLLINLARAFWLLLAVALMAAFHPADHQLLWLATFVVVLAAALTLGDICEAKLVQLFDR